VLDKYSLIRTLSMLFRAAGADPQVDDALTYQGPNQVEWKASSGGAPHTIASHSDTTATGAELETLTDGSNADALHTHAGVGAVDLKPYMVIDTTGNTAIISASTGIILDSEEVADANYSLASNEITISTAGTYWVSYTVSYEILNTSGGDRGSVQAWVEDDDSGSYVACPGSYSYDYHREAASQPGSSCTASFILVLANTSKKIRLRAYRIFGSTNVDTIANHSHLAIFKMG
jgi:hypothetical protein